MPELYRSGLIVRSSIRLQKLRRIPITGQILVKEGEQVTADQLIGYLNPQGYLLSINLASELGISPFDVPDAMLRREGSVVRKGEVIATHRGFLGASQDYASPENGVVESISPYTGRVTIRSHPLPIRANYPGQVERIVPGEGVIISTQGALIQGSFGVGGFLRGPMVVVAQSESTPLTPDLVKPEHEGCIIAGGCQLGLETLDRAWRLGVRGIVVGSMHKSVLDSWLGFVLGTAVTGLETSLTLLLTEGFGTFPMMPTTFAILSHLHGAVASIDGSTRVRAGVIRPELFVPHHGPVHEQALSGHQELRAGQLVRLIRTPRFGQLARVISAEPFLQRVPTEATLLCVQVRLLSTQQEVAVPIANLEVVG
ncbi:MAG: hypothetical protein ACOX2K_09675 [Bacillota bacterium]|jgi:hypothetical protein